MSRGDQPAQPLGDGLLWGGLTIREHFAAMAMQGYLTQDSKQEVGVGDTAEWAVVAADTLLSALEKPDGQ